MQTKEFNMGYAATLTKTGQITVPKWVREALGVQPGQRIVFRKEKNSIAMEREKTVDEITEQIHALIPKEAREIHMREYAGLTANESMQKWMKTEDAKKYLEEERARCL